MPFLPQEETFSLLAVAETGHGFLGNIQPGLAWKPTCFSHGEAFLDRQIGTQFGSLTNPRKEAEMVLLSRESLCRQILTLLSSTEIFMNSHLSLQFTEIRFLKPESLVSIF